MRDEDKAFKTTQLKTTQLKTVAELIETLQAFPPGARVGLAVAGGPDDPPVRIAELRRVVCVYERPRDIDPNTNDQMLMISRRAVLVPRLEGVDRRAMAAWVAHEDRGM